MSSFPTITVLVGQCGNQLGFSFLNTIASAAAATEVGTSFREGVENSFFRPPTHSERQQQPHHGGAESDESGDESANNTVSSSLLVARSVLVDMEPKVMEQSRLSAAHDRRRLFSIHASQCVSREEGSANNWAFGYYSQGASKLEDLEDRLRREVSLAAADDKRSSSSGVGITFHIIHSIAGGTGSGVGCLVSELIAELFPKCCMHHTVVWPFQHGEVVTQWYNTILALSALRDTADSVLVLSNDGVVREMSARHQGGGAALSEGLASASSFRDINQAMAEIMSSLALPVQVLPPVRGVLQDKRCRNLASSSPSVAERWQRAVTNTNRRATLLDIQELLDLDPVKKFFTGATFPRSIRSLSSALQCSSWQSTVQEAVRYTCLAEAKQPLFVLRGQGALVDGGMELQHALAMQRSRTGVCVEWSGSLLASETPSYGANGSLDRKGAPTAAAAFHTSSSTFGIASGLDDGKTAPGGALEYALRKVEGMLSESAFTHHFTRYGLSEDDIGNACIRCWELLEAYGGSRHEGEATDSA